MSLEREAVIGLLFCGDPTALWKMTPEERGILRAIDRKRDILKRWAK